MTRARPYRKREPLGATPRPPHGATLAEIEAWVRDCFEPWLARLRARQAGKMLAPRPVPGPAERVQAERDQMRAATLADMADRIATDRRPISERVPEIFPEILNGSIRSAPGG